MSSHHSDQMSQRSLSLGSLCSVVKTLIVRGAQARDGQGKCEGKATGNLVVSKGSKRDN